MLQNSVLQHRFIQVWYNPSFKQQEILISQTSVQQTVREMGGIFN